jgi:hypothetical protein
VHARSRAANGLARDGRRGRAIGAMSVRVLVEMAIVRMKCGGCR